jgi:hypothetical protein
MSAKRSLPLHGLAGAGVRRRGERGEDEGIRFVALELQSPSTIPRHPAGRRSSLLHARGAAAGDERGGGTHAQQQQAGDDDFLGEEPGCRWRSVSTKWWVPPWLDAF